MTQKRSVSRYYRCMDMPEEVDTDTIEAKMENGVLEIVLPKREPHKKEKKRVKVK